VWVSQRVSGKIFFKFCCVGCAPHCAYRNMWLGGPGVLKKSVIMQKIMLLYRVNIIFYCFKIMRFGYFLTHACMCKDMDPLVMIL
jgi:hypothetical protein